MDLSTILFTCILIWFFCVRSFTFSPRKYRSQMNQDPDAYEKYCRSKIKVPVLKGIYLKVAYTLLNSIVGHFIISFILLKRSGMKHFRTIRMEEIPTFYPYVCPSEKSVINKEENNNLEENELVQNHSNGTHTNGTTSSNKFSHLTISDYIGLYTNQESTPLEVVENLIRVMKKEDFKSLNAIIRYDEDDIRQMAQESTERYKEGKPLSQIDGIPITVKDEIKVRGYKCSYGTQYLGEEIEKHDSAIVAKLRSLGAIIIGITNMHELGNGTTGSNPGRNHGTCRNPHDTSYYSGGSSSGGASATAAGVGVVALGTDGGGSIRIPASFCGLVGLKCTFGRISHKNVRLLAYTVGHLGPLCTSVEDCALMYSLLSQAEHEETTMQVPPHIVPDLNEPIKGIRIGVDHEYNKDCEIDLQNACQRTLNFLEQSGCHVNGINIPENNESRLAHVITILSEMTDASLYDLDHNRDAMTWETRALFTMASHVKAIDYIQANKQRTRCIRFFKKIFEDVDVIVTPATGQAAPAIDPANLVTGSINTTRDIKSMRYVYIGNFIGIPCITVPVGHDSNGLPISVQVMGSWWHEALILRVAAQIQRMPIIYKRPDVYYNALAKSS